MGPQRTACRRTRASRRQIYAGLLAALSVSLVVVPGTAFAKRSATDCITPAGEELNQTFETRDAFVAPYCTEMRTGDRWRAILRIAVAGSEPVFPGAYAPLRPRLDEDFLAKFVSARYVVDAGTSRERSYAFSAGDLVVQAGAIPDGTRFVRWVTPPLHPLPPGDHTVHEYVTLSADFWDGLGLDPAINLIPGGESLAGSVGFSVSRPE